MLALQTFVQEVKDLRAYLQLVWNLEDGVALERVINTPPRGEFTMLTKVPLSLMMPAQRNRLNLQMFSLNSVLNNWFITNTVTEILPLTSVILSQDLGRLR